MLRRIISRGTRNIFPALNSVYTWKYHVDNSNSYDSLSDQEILERIELGEIPVHSIERFLESSRRSVELRRKFFEVKYEKNFDDIPFENFDYEPIFMKNCENSIGYVDIPVGLVGPINMNDGIFFSPLATTEGCLVASVQRGSKAIENINSFVLKDGISRGPVLESSSAHNTILLCEWIEENESQLRSVFESTSNHAKLTSITPTIVGKKLFLRFVCESGEAMGMNMVSKGTEEVLQYLLNEYEDESVRIISVSGNMCTDKKPSSINWIEGRGKSVTCDAVVSKDTIDSIFHIEVSDLVQLNYDKNFLGSAMAGSIGGFNAQASNIVTAMFLATGQDVAQNVESSTCTTLMEENDADGSLYISCTMPSIEVGTIGGGTKLESQRGFLELSGVMECEKPAQELAKLVCATVMCGELSLLSALAKGDLVKSHMKYNR